MFEITSCEVLIDKSGLIQTRRFEIRTENKLVVLDFSRKNISLLMTGLMV